MRPYLQKISWFEILKGKAPLALKIHQNFQISISLKIFMKQRKILSNKYNIFYDGN